MASKCSGTIPRYIVSSQIGWPVTMSPLMSRLSRLSFCDTILDVDSSMFKLIKLTRDSLFVIL